MNPWLFLARIAGEGWQRRQARAAIGHVSVRHYREAVTEGVRIA